jgi:dienelactone hydrolase/tetratricopeptide (TPR) repeat protein
MRTFFATALLALSIAPAIAAAPEPAHVAACRDLYQPGAAYRACSDIIKGNSEATIAQVGLALIQRGTMYLAWHEHANARADFSRARRIIPNSDEAAFQAGMTAEKSGDTETALQAYTAALELNPGNAAARDNRAKLSWAAGEIERTIVDLDINIVRNPDYAASFIRRGMIRATFGQVEGALADFGRADKQASNDFTRRCTQLLDEVKPTGKIDVACGAPLPALRPDQLARLCEAYAPTLHRVTFLASKCSTLAAPETAKEQPLREDWTFLEIRNAAGKDYFEVLTVRDSAAQGRLPVALITHGISGQLLNYRAPDDRKAAHDMAYRGYLAVTVVRHGFGWFWSPDAPPLTPPGCGTGPARQSDQINGRQLATALRALRQRPDAESERAIAIGSSGGGRAVLALAASNPPGLQAVINVSGGTQLLLDRAINCPQIFMIDAMAELAAGTTVPSLWVYAENDSLFRPSAVQLMHAKYRAQGGPATLRFTASLAPFDGHNLFIVPRGRRDWLRELDAFMADKNPPHTFAQQAEALVQRYELHPSQRKLLQSYFSMPTPKVLVASAADTHVRYGGADLRAMEQMAIEDCKREDAGNCRVILRNNHHVEVAMH